MFKKFLTVIKSKDFLFIILIILFNSLPRIAYFVNKGFFIDGDEAIFGTMIQGFLNNGDLPLFFSGQNYGFVSFEVLLGAILGFFFGINIFSMKIAMLLLWLASIIVLYYAGKKIFNSRKWALLATLFASSVPAWFDWATKARGGYLTALLASSVIFLLAVSKKNNCRSVVIGVLLVLIYYAQPLWLPVALPLAAYYFLVNYNFKSVLIFASSLIGAFLGSKVLLYFLGQSYQSQNKLGFEQLASNIKNIISHYYVSYGGRFFDVSRLKLNPWASFNSGVFIGIFILAILFCLYLLSVKKLKKINLAILLSVVLFVIFMLFYNDREFSYRYLLPFFIPAVFLIVSTAKQVAHPIFRRVLFWFLMVYSVFSLICGAIFHNYIFAKINDNYTEVERIEYLKKFLNQNNIKCVYATDWIISQHVDYFIPDVMARHQEIDNRRPQDAVVVDSEYKQNNNCALVGLWYQLPSFSQLYNLGDIALVRGRYLVHLRPQPEDLVRLGFEPAN